MTKPVCLLCKWRDWYIEVPVKTGRPMFVDVCQYNKERVMQIFKRADCPDFAYLDEVK